MTTSMVDEGLDTLVSRALGQTFASGATYAAVPVPWWERFCARASLPDAEVSGVPWGTVCQCRSDNWHIDDEGNVILCLLPMHHEGDCGGPGTLGP